MRWWYFDDSPCRTIVFKPKVVNSISTTTDGYRRGLTVGLTSRVHVDRDRTSEPTETRYPLPLGKPTSVGKRQMVKSYRLVSESNCWPISLKGGRCSIQWLLWPADHELHPTSLDSQECITTVQATAMSRKYSPLCLVFFVYGKVRREG